MAMRILGSTPCDSVGTIFSRRMTSAAAALKCGLRSMSFSSKLLLLASNFPSNAHVAEASL
jgi:hypothetical protein